MKTSFPTLIAILVLVFPFSTPAKTLYVAPTGNDSVTYDANSEISPWRTIGRAAWGSTSRISWNANQAARAGDTVIVQAGTYNASAASGTRYEPAYNPANSGTSTSPITFLAQGAVSLQSTNGTGPVIGAYNRNYIIWDGFYIDEDYVNTRSDTGPAVIWQATGVVLQNLVINGKNADWADNHSSIRLEYASDAVVRNNKLYGNYSQSNVYNQAAVMLYYVNRALIENNEIFDSGGGIFVKGGPNRGLITIRYNLIYDVGPGIAFGDIQDNGARAYQNIVRNSQSAVVYIGYGPNSPVNVDIINNTFVNNSNGVFFKPDTTGYRNLRFLNNVISHNNYAVNGEDITDLTNTSFSNNLYYAASSAFARVAYRNYSFTSWQSAFSKDTIGSVFADALFVNYAGNDFRLQPGSVARTVGVDVFDLDGDGSTTDPVPAGAYITGNETIGVASTATSSLPAPSGVIVVPQ